MKSFKDILAETKKEYGFRIKIAGSVDDEQVDKIEKAMQRWNLLSLSKPKITPIQKHPQDFASLREMEVSIMDLVVEYPTTPLEVLQRISQITGITADGIRVFTDSDQTELKREEDEDTAETTETLLTSPYKKSKDKPPYGDKYNQEMLKKEKRKPGFKVAGGQTSKSKTSNDLPVGKVSPIGSNKNNNPIPTGKK